MWEYRDTSSKSFDRFGQEAFAREYYANYLAHHGIKGQKWGVRRFQNPDGTLTAEGRARYGVGDAAEGAKTLTTAYTQYNNKQKRTVIGARVAGSTAVIGGIAAGVAAGNLVGRPRQGAFAGLTGGKLAEKAIYNVAGTKLTKRMQDDNDVKKSKIVIEEGQEFKRTSTKEKEDGKERLYVSPSLSKYDVGYYEKEWPNYLKKISGRDDTEVYQNTYKTTMSLVAPSLDERKATAQAIVNANKKMREEFAKAYAMDQMRLQYEVFGAKDINDLVKKSSDSFAAKKKQLDADLKVGKIDKKEANHQKELIALAEKNRAFSANFNYNNLVESMTKADNIDMNSKDNFKKFTASIPTSPKLMNTYIKELKKQGYEAVYDDNSNGEAPFIVFDQKYLKQTGSRRIA